MQYLMDDISEVPVGQYQQNFPAPPPMMNNMMNPGYGQQHQQAPQRVATSKTLSMRWQQLLDQSSIYLKTRWSIFAFLTFIFLYRIVALQGFYIIVYALGIFELNLLIGFLTPLNENELENDVIPIHTENNNKGDDFKPFFRRLPEFQFWYACTNATICALFATFFTIFDIPVFWPILLLYFIILFVFTMKKQIQHMIRYKYVPFTIGKKSYAKNGAANTQNGQYNNIRLL
eukprot:UN01321